jgi:hypothetical protein
VVKFVDVSVQGAIVESSMSEVVIEVFKDEEDSDLEGHRAQRRERNLPCPDPKIFSRKVE